MITLRRLLFIDFIIASISCIPLLFMPNNMQNVYELCTSNSNSRECQMITLQNSLFSGRNVCVVAMIFFAAITKDNFTRRGIAFAIACWCFYMPAMYWIHGQAFLPNPISMITIASLLLFGCLYMVALLFDKHQQ